MLHLETNLYETGAIRTCSRLKQRGDPFTFFGSQCYAGSFLVTAGLSLRPNFDMLLVPSSLPYDLCKPYGSHPLLEPNWSTDTMTFAIDGAEAGQIDKIRRVNELYPAALGQLRVCPTKTGDTVNCGSCYKCMRTMAEMRSLGLQELAASSFPQPLDLDLIRRAVLERKEAWNRIGDQAEAAGDLELRDATRIFMGDKFYWRRFLDNLGRHTSRLLRRS